MFLSRGCLCNIYLRVHGVLCHVYSRIKRKDVSLCVCMHVHALQTIGNHFLIK